MSDITVFHNSEVSIEFEKVDGKSQQTELLYELLKERRYSISHRKLPSYEEHKKFASSVPYRVWYLVFRGKACLGSFYLQEDNSIGINMNNESLEVICQCVNFVTENFCPRKEIKSKVPPYFHVNVPHNGGKLKRVMEQLGCTTIQTAFILDC